MSKLENLSLVFFGFFLFIVAFIRIGFFLGIPINYLTLWISLGAYLTTLILIFRTAILKTLILFVLLTVFLTIPTLLLSKTYDTSWDGQGYHQSAVIALANKWNPVYSPDIDFKQELPSEIFAKGYPSALWEIQATIYSLTNQINTAKVVNIAISFVSIIVVYLLLRKLSAGKIISAFLALILVVQPLYVVQLLSFMQDGFGYQLILIASASLVVFILDKKSFWAFTMFIFSEIFLASTKYSHLPLVLVLGLIFGITVINRFLNKEYLVDRKLKLFSLLIVLLSLIFAYLPYGRNFIFYHAPFYPTNVPELKGSVTYNNLPRNLEDKDKLTQLFYGIFSQSQTIESGDTRDASNVAKLKIPFTFSVNELVNSSRLYNNRVGAIGPLFSGIVLLGLFLTIVCAFKAQSLLQKYTIYAVLFGTSLIVITSFLVPTPNLIRYVSYVQFLPFIFIIPALTTFKQKYAKFIAAFVILLMFANNALYASFVVVKTIDETSQINTQFDQMRSSKTQYRVKAQHLYSNYILLAEQKINFSIVDMLSCSNIGQLVASSTTTQYCKN